MPLAAVINRGKITPVGAVVQSTEPFAFGVANAKVEEPYNFGDLSNASSAVEEPFNFGLNASAAVVEPFMFGSNSSAKVVEPFDFGSTGGARGDAIVHEVGTPATRSPLLGWRSR